MSDDNIIDFKTRASIPTETPKVESGSFEFHIMSPTTSETESVQTSGYLKFGPQFIAVVDGPEDTSNVVFAVSTHLVRYVKRLKDGTVVGTLSPG